MNKLQGELTMTFVMGGMSKEKNRPYLQVSNGIEADFVKLSKKFGVDENTFSSYEKGDEITLEVEFDGVDMLVTGLVPA